VSLWGLARMEVQREYIVGPVFWIHLIVLLSHYFST
jgi:hypothetical protein